MLIIEPVNYTKAVTLLRANGVIAYPTESCFGLGCNPKSASAVQRILKMKRRQQSMGVILVGGNLDHILPYLDNSAIPLLDKAMLTWPGPVTWILPAAKCVPHWITGQHQGLAVRISNHPGVKKLCHRFNGAIVSTSANPHGMPSARNSQQTAYYFGKKVDYILSGITSGNSRPSKIMNGETGLVLRN